MTTRRHFIKTGTLLASGMALQTANAFAASDTIRLAIVGLRSKGTSLARDFARLKKAKIVALCDVDSQILASAAKKLAAKIGPVDLVEDYRKLLERKDIDAVVLATPNHWHALQTIWACQAGKDVYVEKPCSHSIWEGRKMIEAARKYDRIVQVGLQASSSEELPEAAEWIRAGNIGKIQAIHAIWYRPRTSIGKKTKPIDMPAGLNYDLWLGPAADEPIYRNEIHYDWHWDWNTGNGEMGNIGTHVADVARFFLGDPLPPKRISTFGQRFLWHDAGNTPNMHVAAFHFEEAPLILELNNFKLSPDNARTPAIHKTARGEIVICEGGKFVGHGGGKVFDNDGNMIKSFRGGDQHQQNFIEAVISRRKDALNCEIERGHASCSLSLLGGIAWRAGQETAETEMKNRTSDNPWLADAFERYNKQAKDWGLNLTNQPWISSFDLNYDSAAEQFVGTQSAQANAYLKREAYREAFVVPDQV